MQPDLDLSEMAGEVHKVPPSGAAPFIARGFTPGAKLRYKPGGGYESHIVWKVVSFYQPESPSQPMVMNTRGQDDKRGTVWDESLAFEDLSKVQLFN